ncbi:MAG: serine hydrolase [Phycisphaerales bacterium]|nr:serine hydrolase [Phycisphaerales bacterium]
MIKRLSKRAYLVASLVGVMALTPAWAGLPAATVQPAAAFVASQGIKTSDAELSKRLAELSEKLEKRRAENHLPGMALGIVKDDQVVLARGFGQRNIEKNLPVDEHTLFAIGSQTKAFTSMLVSMLADEGKLSWDDPVSKHVPGFKLYDKDADAAVTLRDLCCHRTGLPRTDMLWASGKASKQQMMERLAFAEPTAKFRESWQYNNTMFMVAGMAAGNVAGSDWPSLIKTRIFTPLGMNDSDTSINDMLKHPQHATGYKWDEDSKQNSVLPMRLITCDGAGAINSSVSDMSNWLRMLLAKGQFQGKRLVSEQMIDQMWSPQISMGSPDASYGLGWMLQSWNGKPVVHHGGNIDGFFCMLAMLPDERLGFVLLGSLTHSSLQGESLNMVWETFFPPAPTNEGVLTEAQLQAYVGKYHFDQMGIDLSANIKDGMLHLDVPGQMNFELKWPDAEGKWVFAMTDQIKTRFNKNDKGEVESLTMFQSGLEFTLPRLGPDGKPIAADKPGPFTLDQLREFTGTYHFSPANQEWKVIIKNGKLAVDVPQQMAFELIWPDEAGKWKVAAAPAAMACSFNRDAQGKVESMTWYQNDNELKLPRTAPGETSNLPTIEQLSELRRKSADPEKVRGMNDIEAVGKVRMTNQGVEGTVRGVANADGRTFQDLDFGLFGFIRSSDDGKHAWTHSVGENLTELTGDRLAEARRAGAQFVITDFTKLFDTVEVVERSKLDGKDVIVIRGRTTKPDKTTVQYLDPALALPLKEETSMLIPGLGRLPITVKYEDYKDISGVMMPMKVVIASAANGSMEITFDRITPNATIPADTYTLKPAP